MFGDRILRLRGAYFALATIGVNEAVSVFVTNFEPWGAATGLYLSLDAYAPLGGPGRALWIIYFLMIQVVGLSLGPSYVIRHSKFGLGLLAIGQNEARHQPRVPTAPTRPWYTASPPSCRRLPAASFSLRAASLNHPRPSTSPPRSKRCWLCSAGKARSRDLPLVHSFTRNLRGYLLTAQLFSHFQLVIAGLLLLVIVLFAPGGLIGFITRKFPSHDGGWNDSAARSHRFEQALRRSRSRGWPQFQPQRGEATGLIGPNGAGKSTVFNLIDGVTHSGRIKFDGAISPA